MYVNHMILSNPNNAPAFSITIISHVKLFFLYLVLIVIIIFNTMLAPLDPDSVACNSCG